MQELLDYAASSQDEVCALILNGERVFRCRNVHPEPWHHFRISDDDWLAAEEEGRLQRSSIRTRKASQRFLVLTGRCRL
jgi:proteasome lid subunit RPN8/RPN11